MKKITISLSAIRQALGNYQNVLGRIPWVLGMHAFLCIIVCLVLSISLGEFLFYNYVFLVNVQDPEAVVSPVKFDEQAYQSVLQEWQNRQALFQSASKQNISTPFK